MLLAQSRAFVTRPVLLQWCLLAAQARPSAFPTRAMHFSELLRAQSVSRQILLQPSTLLALRKQSQHESALNHPYWSKPLHTELELSSLRSKLPQPHVISATKSPSSPPAHSAWERSSQQTSRAAAAARPPWVPANVVVTATTETKRHMGPR